MPRLPGGAVQRAGGVETILRAAQLIDGKQDQPLGGKWKAGNAVAEGSVAIEIAAGGKVAGEGGGTLPHLASAAGKAIVVGRELLTGDDPDTLRQKKHEQQRCQPLRPTYLKCRNLQTASAFFFIKPLP